MAAELGRGAGEAVGVGLEVRVGVRLHAELRQKQQQRQQIDDQATMTSEQNPYPPARQVSAEFALPTMGH